MAPSGETWPSVLGRSPRRAPTRSACAQRGLPTRAVGQQRLWRAVTLSAEGDSLTSTLPARILDPADHVVQTICSVETGARQHCAAEMDLNARVPRPDTAGPPGARTFRFGAFSLLPEARLLIAADRPVKVGGRAFDILVALVQRCERTVSKHELMDLVWPNRVVEENNLEVQMVALRKLLGHHAVATVSGCGYRFALSVHADGGPAIDDDVAALVAQITRAGAGADEVDEALRLRLVAAVVRLLFPGGLPAAHLLRLPIARSRVY